MSFFKVFRLDELLIFHISKCPLMAVSRNFRMRKRSGGKMSADDPQQTFIKLPNHPAVSGQDDKDWVNIRVVFLGLAILV
jgi:hypothetical protein